MHSVYHNSYMSTDILSYHTMFPGIVPQLVFEQQRSLFHSPSVIILLGPDDIRLRVQNLPLTNIQICIVYEYT